MGQYGDTFNAAVATELRAQRGRVKITVAQLAEQAGMSKSAALNYLNGKREIPLPAFAELCRVLRVSRADIFDAAEKSLEQD